MTLYDMRYRDMRNVKQSLGIGSIVILCFCLDVTCASQQPKSLGGHGTGRRMVTLQPLSTFVRNSSHSNVMALNL